MIAQTRFLREGVEFPAGLGERAWGHHGLGLELAGMGFRVVGLAGVQLDALHARFGAYCSEAPPSPVVRVRTFAAEPGVFLPPPPPPWEYMLHLEHSDATVYWVGVGEAGLLRLGAPVEAAMWMTADGGAKLTQAVENLLRLAVAYALCARGGALLHGACVVDGGSAVVFPGVSGSGKTTASRLSAAEGRLVVSDDIVGVLPGRGGFEVVALPFGSEFRFAGPRHARFPLRTLCRLEKGGVTEVRTLSRPAAFALALACAPYVKQDPLRVERVFGVIENVTGAVALRTLCFPKRGPIWSALSPGAL